MDQLLWMIGQAAIEALKVAPEFTKNAVMVTMYCDDDGALHFQPYGATVYDPNELDHFREADVVLFGWQDQVFWQDRYTQCLDHPYCLQPAGHEEDPELLAIIDRAQEESE